MNLFVQDLVADLREKRLWPVALALLVALVAVPVVLAKPFEEPPPAAPQRAQGKLPKAGLKVLTAEDNTGKGSDLGVFDPRDPFRPPTKVLGKEDSSTSTTDSAAAGPSDAGAGADLAAAGGGASQAGSAGGGSGGNVPAGGGGSGPSKPTIRTQQFAYVIDATFKHNTRTRRIKGMDRLDMLPSESNPLLIFMGVDAKGGNAVFMIDATLKGAGEGKCKPSEDKCSFLYLGPGSEHQFTGDDGDTYTLRIDQIRRERIRASASRKPRSERDSKRSDSADTKPRAEDSSTQERAFVPPVLIDLIDVATTKPANSGRAKRHR